MQVDSDDAALSRSASVQPPHEGENGTPMRRSVPQRDKGKGKERTGAVRVKEEPTVVNINEASHLNEIGRAHV